MSAKKLLEALDRENGAKEQEILKAARAEAEKIRSQARVESEAHSSKLENELAGIEERMKMREVSSVELKLKSELLKRETRDFNNVKDQAFQKLLNLSKEDNEKVLKLLIQVATSELEVCKSPILTEGVKLNFSSKKDDISFIEKNSSFSSTDSFTDDGGLIVSTSDGSLIYDLRYSKMLDEYWTEALKTVASLLKW